MVHSPHVGTATSRPSRPAATIASPSCRIDATSSLYAGVLIRPPPRPPRRSGAGCAGSPFGPRGEVELLRCGGRRHPADPRLAEDTVQLVGPVDHVRVRR